MRSFGLEFSKFTGVGAVNFLFTLVAYYLLVERFEVNYLIALVTVSLLGMVLTYSLNHVWVFRPEEKLAFRQRFGRYVLAGASSIALNAWILAQIVRRTGRDPFYVQLALIPLIVAFNFSTAKYWSLRPSRQPVDSN